MLGFFIFCRGCCSVKIFASQPQQLLNAVAGQDLPTGQAHATAYLGWCSWLKSILGYQIQRKTDVLTGFYTYCTKISSPWLVFVQKSGCQP